MKKYLMTGIFLLALFAMQASEVTIIITSMPANTPPEDNIYIAGSFNNWNPGNPEFILQPNTNNQPEIFLAGTGTIEFKFTRGSWATVEGGETGGYIPNRTFTFGSSDTLEIVILSWEDLGAGGSTAAQNVIVMDNSFFMPQFNRTRRIWLYLPPDYETSGKDYPVLYMHDGQNLFDLYTSFAGEWEVDETLNSLFDEGKEVPIVVGIDNGGAHRLAEYTPWPHPQYGGGDGDLYAQFIVETLKPHIDANYRTKPQRAFTGIMGSSLGGLISHYIAIKHQDVFGKAGIFSPSFWYSDSSYSFVTQTGSQFPMRYYMMGGTNESGGLVGQMQNMIQTLLAAGFDESELELKIVQGGQHNEYLWRTQFGEAYEWLFLDDVSVFNSSAKMAKSQIKVMNHTIYLETGNPFDENKILTINIFSTLGNNVFNSKLQPGQPLQVPEKLKGIYIINITDDRQRLTKKAFFQ